MYASRHSSSYAWLKLEEGPQSHFNIYRLNPDTGEKIWGFYQPRVGLRSDASGTWVVVQFADEVKVLKFFSL